MAFAPEELALELIAWPPRLRAGLEEWPASDRLSRLFAEHLCRKQPSWHTEDVDIVLRRFGREATRPYDWYVAVLRPFDDALAFKDGAPRIRTGSLARWRELTSRVDADALACLRLARTTPHVAARQAIERLVHWGYQIGLDDAGFGAVMARGVADVHVHLEGCDPIPLLWDRVMRGRERVEALPSYSRSTVTALSDDETAARERVEERDAIERAVAARHRMMATLGIPAGRRTERQPTPAEALLDERTLLVAAWRRAAEDRAFAVELDGYVVAKSAFLGRHVQRAGSGVGLTRFREYLDRAETIGEGKGKWRSPGVLQARFERMLSLATHGRDLRTLELRVAPADSVEGYVRTFRSLDRGIRTARARGTVADVGVVVHFIRHRRPDPTPSVAMAHGWLRARLDRQSAALHAFRHAHPDLARLIVGLDVANLERGAPPELFAPYLSLLRGDRRFSPDLEHPALRRWQGLAARRLLESPDGLPGLGLTYHAGEDFHDPVDGLRSISGLLRHVLVAGDRIGHGLVLGLDLAAMPRTRRMGPTPAGLALDNLTWLRGQARASRLWDGPKAAAMDDAIDELARRVYAQPHPAYVLERSLDERFALPSPAWSTEPDPARRVAWADAFDPRVASAREEYAGDEVVDVIAASAPLVEQLQRQVTVDLRERGVTIEFAPSSNLATGAVGRFEDHPFFACREALGGRVLTSFNTDDPGVFSTSVDVEHGLMFEAMLRHGFDRLTALDALDEARRVGLAQAFGDVRRPIEATSRRVPRPN